MCRPRLSVVVGKNGEEVFTSHTFDRRARRLKKLLRPLLRPWETMAAIVFDDSYCCTYVFIAAMIAATLWVVEQEI